MKIKQHIPNFCSGLEPQEVEFNSLAELMAIPWVKHWTDDKDFFRFSISDGRYLMAEAHTGRIWWVVGYLTDCQLDLPKHERVTAAPVPRPTEIKDDRIRCGMVRRKTAEEISREWKEYCLRLRRNLTPIVE